MRSLIREPYARGIRCVVHGKYLRIRLSVDLLKQLNWKPGTRVRLMVDPGRGLGLLKRSEDGLKLKKCGQTRCVVADFNLQGLPPSLHLVGMVNDRDPGFREDAVVFRLPVTPTRPPPPPARVAAKARARRPRTPSCSEAAGDV